MRVLIAAVVLSTAATACAPAVHQIQHGGPPEPHSCAVAAQPTISQEPLRYIRTKVTIDDGSGGRLFLVDEGGEWTTGDIQPGPRTTWVVWSNVVLPAGDYEVQLKTGRGCFARGRLEVN